MLEMVSASGEYSIGHIAEILESVHLNNLTTYTLYSNIYDLKNGRIHLYYLSQYDEMVVLDLKEMISEGERIVEMRDLFTLDTVDAGQAAYRWFETRFTIVRIAVVAAILLLIVGLAALVIKKRRGQQQVEDIRTAAR